MCGIVGYIGESDCVPVLIEGLKRLEYRGYDSSGITVIARKALKTYKKEGKIIALETSLPPNLKSTIGIAHTRWATHGAPTDINAHPHISQNERISIVHNGIIENYKQIRAFLEKDGFSMKTDTDSEVISHLIEKYYTDSFEDAFHKAINHLEGAYGIVAVCADEPDFLMVARKGSPLILGIGEKEIFIASDASAFLGYTKQVVYLEDYEIARVEKKRFIARDFRLTEIEKNIDTIDWELSEIERGEYSHFMLKEIHEQPESIQRCLAGRIVDKIGTTKLGGLELSRQELFELERIKIIACGTSYHAGLVGAYAIEELSRMNCYVEVASELRYKNPIIEKGTLYFAVSQSGETADTLFAMREIQRKGAKVLGICNVVGSTIARESDGGIYVHSGPEISVASTKAFTSQLSALYLYAILMGRMRDLSFYRGSELITQLQQVPDKIQKILEQTDKIEAIAKKFSKLNNFLFLGRRISYPVALEAALKLKEVSYLHSEGIPAGEIKHGPIALIDKDTPVIFIAPKDHVHEKVLSNIEQVRSRGGRIMAICTEGDEKIKELVEDFIEVPEIDPIFSPLLTIIPLQLFTYFVARELGCDIDKPRNLAKSVTVE
jgi:glucosamine--fructose-6-phosphate aminotransferase (isomerizing)